MRPPSRQHGQLDIPLVWEMEPAPPPPEPSPDDPFPGDPYRPASAGQLILAAVADLGVALLAMGFFWTLALVLGAGLGLRQAGAAGVAAAEAVLVVFACTIWGWRGTPGMLVCGTRLSAAPTLRASLLTAMTWFVTLPLAGVPAVVGRPGSRPLELCAGAPFSSR